MKNRCLECRIENQIQENFRHPSLTSTLTLDYMATKRARKNSVPCERHRRAKAVDRERNP